MKVFILKIGVFSLLIGLLCTLIISQTPLISHYFFNSQLAKSQRLHSLKSPKIVFIGGSNLLFGLDSALVEKELHEDVVNMGLNAGVGLYLIGNSIRPFIHPGDTVVVALEYDYYFTNIYGSGSVSELALIDNSLFKYFNFQQALVFLKYFPFAFERRVVSYFSKEVIIPGYDDHEINAYGDNEGHLKGDRSWIYNKDTIIPMAREISPSARDYLKELIDDLHSRGAHIYITWASIPRSRFRDYGSEFKAFNQKVIQAFSENNILGTVGDFIFEDIDFYDSEYHLLGPARALRTAKIIHLMADKRALGL